MKRNHMRIALATCFALPCILSATANVKLVSLAPSANQAVGTAEPELLIEFSGPVDVTGFGLPGGVLVSSFRGDTTAPRVVSLDPDLPDCDTVVAMLSLTIGFDDEMDAATLIAANASLIASGGDGTFDEGNERPVTLTDPVYDPGLRSARFALDPPLSDEVYRFTLTGAVQNAVGAALDGEYPGLGGPAEPLPSGDGSAGGTFVIEFSVDSTQDCNENGEADLCDLIPRGFAFPHFSSVAGLNLLGEATQAGSVIRLVHNSGWRAGAVWRRTKQRVTGGFQTAFEFNINPSDAGGADGIVFVVQNDNDEAIGGAGSELGYGGILNSVAVEFDTWEGNDPSLHHVAVHTGGTGPNSAEWEYSLGSTTDIPPIWDATDHTVQIQYTPGMLLIFLDDLDNPVLAVPVDLDATLALDGGYAWVGLTAATGGRSQNHDLWSWTFESASADCNGNGLPDECELEGNDCNSNGVPDTCEPEYENDCNDNTVPDMCDMGSGASLDCNGNGMPDECDIADGLGDDDNGNGIIDECELVVDRVKPCGNFVLTPMGAWPNDVTGAIRTFDRFGRPVSVFLDGQIHASHAAPSFDQEGNLFLGQWFQGTVLVMSAGGDLIRTISAGGLTGTTGTAINPDGNLTVGSYLSDSVKFYTVEGEYLGNLGHGGTEDPKCFAYDRAGNLFIGSRNNGNGRIAVFDDQLNFVRYIGEGILLPDPPDMAFDKSENLWVTVWAGSIHKFSHDGTLLQTITHPGLNPAGIALDENENLYVTNRDSFEVYVFSPDGALLNQLPIDLGPDPDPSHELFGIAFTVGADADCNGNGVGDACDILYDTSEDCQPNGIPDECELDANDCNNNNLPDNCELDCNANGAADDCDILDGTSDDCNTNGVPDECDPDCNTNDRPDDCDIADGTSDDCNDNTVPDECEIDSDPGLLEFDGLDDLVRIPINVSERDYTVSLWFKTSCSDCAIYSVYEGLVGGDTDRSIYLNNGNLKAFLYANETIATTGTDFADDEWHHVAHVYGTSVGGQVLYVDGVPRASGSKTSSDFDWQTGVLIGYVNHSPLNYFAGQIDEVRIWHGPLTAQEIIQDRSGFVVPRVGSLQGRWNLGEPLTEQAVWDMSGNGHHGTLGVSANPGWDDPLRRPNETTPYRVPDCNANEVPDVCDISDGVSGDCNSNGVADECEFAGTLDCNSNGLIDLCEQGGAADCNQNELPDWCDVADGTSDDCNSNGVPDECEFFGTLTTPPDEAILNTDNGNYYLLTSEMNWPAAEEHAVSLGGHLATIRNEAENQWLVDAFVPLTDELAVFMGFNDIESEGKWVWSSGELVTFVNWGEGEPSGTSEDWGELILRPFYSVVPGDWNNGRVTLEGIVEITRVNDCNDNDVLDECDIATGSSGDCNTNEVPDECESDADCNGNGVQDLCDLADGTSADCNEDAIPDECELADNDCNANAVPDECEDCNKNGLADECDLEGGTSEDCNTNDVPDECEVDCNENSVPDDCDIVDDTSYDFDGNGVPDECQPDCNENGFPDFLDLVFGFSVDCNGNDVPDECDLDSGASTDCNGNDAPDECDIASGESADCDANAVPDECEPDSDGDGIPNACDGFGDFDHDADVDLDDYQVFEGCLYLSGPFEPPPFLDCLKAFDGDLDDDVDLGDFAAFQIVCID